MVAAYDQASPPFRVGLLQTRRELAHVRLHRGEYTESVGELRSIALECHERWGDASPHTLLARFVLAEALAVAGSVDEAVTLRQQVIDCSARVVGIRPKHVAYLRVALADTLIRAGRLDEAERELVAIAPAYAAAESGVEATLTFRSTLAAAATERGRHEDALHQRTELLPQFVKRYGEEHPRTLDIRFETAKLRHRLGDSAAAMAAHRAVLGARTRVLGEEHPDTIKSREALGGAT